jgi:hypothetical protein
MKLLRIISVAFDITDELITRSLHSSYTAEKIVVQWDSTSAIHRLQENLRIS